MFGTNYGYGNVNPNMGTAPYAGGFTAGVQALKGRQVASVDEVKATQVDFSGNISYYPCPAVYTKMAYAYLTDVDAPKGRAVMTYIWTHDL